jgi:glutamate racemase
MMRCVLLTLILVVQLNADALSDARRALEKDAVTILITDSGLGGLSVAADFERIVRLSKQFKTAHIVFCNALPGTVGYNDLKDASEKAKVFSRALSGMAAWYHPDIIVIACNTLSVVYEQTEFSKTTAIPVVGIVDMTVDLLTATLTKDKGAVAILFGTETTIDSKAHITKLAEKGIVTSRIISQACPKLESEIQTDPSSDMVRSYVDWYVGEAVTSVPANATKVYAGMVCTHYGYSADVFLSALKSSGVREPEIINPNTAMAAAILPETKKIFTNPIVDIIVVSRAPISAEEIRSIAALLAGDSQPTATALERYIHKPDLFEFTN